MNIRENLVELMGEHNSHYVVFCDDCFNDTPEEFNSRLYGLADHLITNGVTMQKYACWDQILDCGIGRCYGRCSSCRTQHKANSYGELMTEHRYCRWCGAKLLYEPPKGE